MWILLTLAAFGTAVLSATFGMAGGLVLMGVYTAVLPVPTAMVLHGLTQLLANGLRAVVHRREIHWPGVARYTLGAAAAWGLLRLVDVVPSATTVYLLLGSLPFLARLVPHTPWLRFTWGPAAALAGFAVVGVQLLAGVAGPVLDVFFLDKDLDRHAVVGTKAATQSLSHLLKIAFFGALVPPGGLAGDAVAAVLLGAALGTAVGTRLLDRWSDEGFRTATRRLILGIGAVYLALGLWPVLRA